MTRFTLAIPSKGRLKEQTEAWLAGIGHPVRQIGGERGYTAEIEGLDAEVRLLSAREIAEGLIEGSLHFGVTGEDLLYDLSPDGPEDFRVVQRLGFGPADVVVAVPQAWLDVDTMADLEAAGAAFRKAHHRRLRVATKYLRLTRRYFAQKSVGEYRLVESAGATEAAPSTGTADVIVDITTTGATLRANGLKILSDGVILSSQASLAQSLKAAWPAAAEAAKTALLRAISGADH
ncbi:ATP phosphoribosyltransferase [Hyphomonas sp.]|uniref:ATP phosphoribosyltransferase n=1 Tax=Hyphomonas sp. TaxID=87 RepID=UPI00391C98BF